MKIYLIQIKGSLRSLPIPYMLKVCEVYNNAANLLLQKTGDSIDINNFRRKGDR